jgi:hypothetical protein
LTSPPARLSSRETLFSTSPLFRLRVLHLSLLPAPLISSSVMIRILRLVLLIMQVMILWRLLHPLWTSSNRVQLWVAWLYAPIRAFDIFQYGWECATAHALFVTHSACALSRRWSPSLHRQGRLRRQPSLRRQPRQRRQLSLRRRPSLRWQPRLHRRPSLRRQPRPRRALLRHRWSILHRMLQDVLGVLSTAGDLPLPARRTSTLFCMVHLGLVASARVILQPLCVPHRRLADL